MRKVFNWWWAKHTLHQSAVHLSNDDSQPESGQHTLCGRPVSEYAHKTMSDKVEATCKTCMTKEAALDKEAT